MVSWSAVIIHLTICFVYFIPFKTHITDGLNGAIALATYWYVTWFWKCSEVYATDKVLCLCKPKFQKKPPQFSYGTNSNASYLVGVLYWSFLVPQRFFFRRLDWNSLYNTVCGKTTRLQKIKQVSYGFSFFSIHSRRTLPSVLNCIRILSMFCVFPVRERVQKVQVSFNDVGPYFLG